jgi:hypothetical protein
VIDGHGLTALTWTGVGGVVYDVVSSTLSDLSLNGTGTAACLSSNGSSTGYVDDRPGPAQDDGYYYLIRARNSCGSGTFGYGSAGVERVPTATCP